MIITSYRENGKILYQKRAIHRAKGGDGWIEGTWIITLEDGKEININENDYHPAYNGWEELPVKN